MNNTKLECSLNDTTILRNLILENPELPLITFVGECAWDGEHSWSQAHATKGEIEELTIYNDMWLDKEKYTDKIADDLRDEEEHKNMSSEKFEQMIDEKVAETEFVKAIVVWIG